MSYGIELLQIAVRDILGMSIPFEPTIPKALLAFAEFDSVGTLRRSAESASFSSAVAVEKQPAAP